MFRQIGLRDRVGDARRFCRIVRGDTYIHDIGALGALHLDSPLERIQRGKGVVARAGAAEPRWSSDKFRIVVKRFRFDHPPQHVVGSQYPDLALDQKHRGIVGLIRRREIGRDGVQIRRVDQNLGRRGVPIRNEG